MRPPADEEQSRIDSLLPARNGFPKGVRKPVDNRGALGGVSRIIPTGARWKAPSDKYPSPSACSWRLRDSKALDMWVSAWRGLVADLDDPD
jgi:hypothetical protein